MVNSVSVISAVLGGFIVLFGLISGFVKQRLYVSEACECFGVVKINKLYRIHSSFIFRDLVIATAIGIAFGPVGARWFVPEMLGNEEAVTREFCRLVIAIQVMAAGVALPKAYLRREFLSLLILLIPGMIWMWLSSSLFVWGLIPGLNFVNTLSIFLHRMSS
jgi:NhaP-type Na+/H+ or K+/H+ antiporter